MNQSYHQPLAIMQEPAALAHFRSPIRRMGQHPSIGYCLLAIGYP
jgi:hypothetical protein